MSLRARCTILVAIGGVCGARVAPAQRITSSVDVSGTGVWYADTIRSAGTSVSPAVRLDWSRATLGATTTLSRLGGGMSVQGDLAPSVFTPTVGPAALEFAGALGGSTHEDGSRTGQLLALSRLHLVSANHGLWLGGGVGRSWDGVSWRGVRQAEIGAWAERNALTALASVTPVVVDDTIRYADLQAAVRAPFGAYDVGLTTGLRTGASGPAVGGSARAWGIVSALAWISPRVAVVAAAGSYPVDFTQGFPGGRFVSVALRIASANARAVSRPVASARTERATEHGDDRPVDDHARAAGVRAFEVHTQLPGQSLREIRVLAPTARRVELSADFTGWQPIALSPAGGGWWSVARKLDPGTYQLNLRVDGGAWLAPPGLLASRDEFDGVVGILTIE
ncbi:MAG TPA: glycogen-binding domain-containing protein [Gemmatimonadaceae bacterium]|nr:glycogen-binding domain-containing protein [Gemmatimonadaceae bacterium]